MLVDLLSLSLHFSNCNSVSQQYASMGCAQSVKSKRHAKPDANAKNANAKPIAASNQVANTHTDSADSGNEAHSSTTEGLSAEERRARIRAKH